MPLHKGRLIEFDAKHGRARISPRGAKEVEEKLLKPAGARNRGKSGASPGFDEGRSPMSAASE